MTETSKLLSNASLVGSVLTILLGITYLIYGFTFVTFNYPGCTFFNCNTGWRGFISFSPDVFMDTFQPIIIGSIGVMYYFPSRPTWPVAMSTPGSSFLWGYFHIVMALFGNLGYIYWVGIAICTYNLLVGSIIVVSKMVRGRGVGGRPKDVDEMTNHGVTADQPVVV
jgi:hypothetical protein